MVVLTLLMMLLSMKTRKIETRLMKRNWQDERHQKTMIGIMILMKRK